MIRQQIVFWIARIAAAIAGLGGCSAFAHEYVIIPIQHFGKPCGIRITVPPPEGWQYRGTGSQTMLGFVLRGTPTPPPGVDLVPQVQLVVTSHLAREVTVPKERLEDTKYSLAATWMEGGTPIEEFRKVESIDAGPYGTLPLWLIRGGAYSYYLVIIQREGVLIEAALRRVTIYLTHLFAFSKLGA